MICMQKWSAEQSVPRFNFEFMVWKKFFNAIMCPGKKENSDLLKRMSKADLVIGGVDMSISYL